MGIPVHLTRLLRNLYASQEATARTGHGTTDWFQIGKRVCQGCILSPCLYMRYTGLDEAQARIKISRRNINNLRYADDITLMTESEEELKRLLMKVKEESEKVGFSSVQFSSVTQLCLTLRPHGLQHARPPCPSPTPGICSNSRPLSRWCHPTISSSIVPFSCLQSFPASGSFIYLFSAQRFLFIHNIGSYLSQQIFKDFHTSCVFPLPVTIVPPKLSSSRQPLQKVLLNPQLWCHSCFS